MGKDPKYSTNFQVLDDGIAQKGLAETVAEDLKKLPEFDVFFDGACLDDAFANHFSTESFSLIPLIPDTDDIGIPEGYNLDDVILAFIPYYDMSTEVPSNNSLDFYIFLQAFYNYLHSLDIVPIYTEVFELLGLSAVINTAVVWFYAALVLSVFANSAWFYYYEWFLVDRDIVGYAFHRLFEHRIPLDVAFDRINIYDSLLGGWSWLLSFFSLIIIVVCLLVAIAYLTLFERKIMAAMQRRQGPNVIGFYGLLQPLADGLKLLLKELIIPQRANKFLFLLAPLLVLFLGLLVWVFLPLNGFVLLTSFELSSVYLIVINSLDVYGILLAGWASNSKYALLGGLRASAQMLSYELSMGFVFVTLFAVMGTADLFLLAWYQTASSGFYILNIFYLPLWNIFPFFPLAVIFFISMLAETNRTPFDLPEAEAELVAGYNVEYSGMLFAFFFLAEYANMIYRSVLFVLLFLGGWNIGLWDYNIDYVAYARFQEVDFFFGFDFFSVVFDNLPIVDRFLFAHSLVVILAAGFFSLKVVMVLFVFVWVRATLPRYRYDQLMSLGWKVLLPVSFAFFVFYVVLLFCFGLLPQPYLTMDDFDLSLVWPLLAAGF